MDRGRGGGARDRRDAPHPWGAMLGRPSHDVWAVDLADGTRRQVAERLRYEWASPDRGRWFMQKADSVDRFVFRVESREEAPELVMTDGRFGERRLVAESNRFQSEYG